MGTLLPNQRPSVISGLLRMDVAITEVAAK